MQELGGGDERAERDELVRGAAMACFREPLQVLERARGDTSAFDQIYEQYRLAPEGTRQRLYYETMEAVLSNVDKTIVEARGVTPYLPLNEVQRRLRAPEAVTKGGE